MRLKRPAPITKRERSIRIVAASIKTIADLERILTRVRPGERRVWIQRVMPALQFDSRADQRCFEERWFPADAFPTLRSVFGETVCRLADLQAELDKARADWKADPENEALLEQYTRLAQQQQEERNVLYGRLVDEGKW